MSCASRPLGFRRVYLLGVLTAGVLATGLVTQATRAALAPDRSDGRISKAVARFLADEHLSKAPLNEEMSRRTFTTFLKMLDPMKVYFLQTDVDEFAKQQNVLIDQIRSGNTTFAYTVFERFLQRVDDRVKTVDQLLTEKPDFTIDEEIISDPKLTTYAKDEAEGRDKWRKRIKYDLLVKKADAAGLKDNVAAATKDLRKGATSVTPERPAKSTKDAPPEERISKRYHSFAKRMHQTKAEELLERYLTALTSSFDPHTSYMSPS